MSITYRYFENPSDLKLQEKFWLEQTKNLPFPWKPSKIQEFFSKKADFDFKSKYFVFDGKELLGYESFVVGRTLIALGYPWVKEHPQKREIQEKLWNDTIAILDEKFPHKYLRQRFREQWKAHLQYFIEKGFSLDQEFPIYMYSIEKEPNLTELNKDLYVRIHNGLQEDLLRKVLETKENFSPEQIEMVITSAQFLDYDFSIYIEINKAPVIYVGITIRFDASYAEIALLESADTSYDKEFVYNLGIQISISELFKNKVKIVSVTIEENEFLIPILEKLGFYKGSTSVYVRKNR